ncbi:MAG: nucleoside hydrolase [Acidimicrobiia bacterium]
MASATERPRIILDCDPGHDDAIAIIVASAHTDLLGVTTVAGNAPLERTTRNALIVLDLIGRADVPMHSGAERPLVAPARHADHIHGESGLDGATLPSPSRPPTSADAVEFIVDTCRATEGVWLVPVGPLTNIALALRAAPDLAGRIAGISLMGGGRFGNRTAAAEFNIWADPEAARIVFGYGGPLTMAGLDLTFQLQATAARIEAVRAVGTELATLFADLLVFFSHSYVSRHEHLHGAPVHDPCAVLALTHPQLFTSRMAHVEIETAGTVTRGMTLIDDRALVERPAPNCRVLQSIDDDAAFDVIVEAVRTSSGARRPG